MTAKEGSASRSVTDVLAAYSQTLGGMSAAARQAYRTHWELPADYNDYWHYQAHYRGHLPSGVRFQHLDLATYVPECLLTQLDRQSMRLGLEVRAPLLDQDLVEWIAAAPDRLRLPQFDLEAALLPQLPDDRPILGRLKQSIRNAAQLLPGSPGAGRGAAGQTLLRLLHAQFPELDTKLR